MQRLLIVDDEIIICDGLYEILSRESSLNLDIYKCYSAQEAMQLIEQYRFDILLTDIQMPGMTGLQLADVVRQKWPKCRIVFLTGHHDFDYIYTAISYERVNYILKTEGYDKVIEAVKFAVADTIKVKELELYVEENQHQQKYNAKQLFLNELIYGNLPHLDINYMTFNQIGLNLVPEQPVLTMMAQYSLAKSKFNFTERMKLKYELTWIAETYFSDFPIKTDVLLKDSQIIWLCQPEENSNWEHVLYVLQNHLEPLQDMIKRQCKLDLSFILDKAEIDWSTLANRIEQLNILFQYRYGRADEQLILSANMMNEEQRQLVETTGVSLSKISQLEHLLQNAQQVEFEKQLELLLEQLANVEQDSISEEIYLHTAMVYFSYMNKWSINEDVSKSIPLAKLLHYREHMSKSDAIDYLERLGKHLISFQLEAQEKRAFNVIEKLQSYICENIDDPNKLTLVHLSEISFFNTSYLSRLFKQITGKNVTDFIVEVKMERAKALLVQNQLKIQDVAEQLGYSNATNFSRVFKKQFNMTPQDYRFTLTNTQ